jgi:hypothetical protein
MYLGSVWLPLELSEVKIGQMWFWGKLDDSDIEEFDLKLEVLP